MCVGGGGGGIVVFEGCKGLMIPYLGLKETTTACRDLPPPRANNLLIKFFS